jgi:hypothetical protein
MIDIAALKSYADRHGLVHETGRPIASESLIRFTTASDHSLTGTLPGGFDGTIALTSVASDDGTTHQTLCTTSVPESIAFLPKLYCRDASFKHTRSYTLGSEGFRSDWRGTEFESDAVNRTWAVQVAPDQDEGWLRELFAPTFLDWLGSHSPQDFTFEVVEGALTCRFDHAADDERDLDRLCELTAHVAERIRTESLEEERPAAPFSAPLPPPEATPERVAADRAVAKRRWDQPPEDMMSAMRGYEGIARREPGGWKAPILLGGGIALLVFVVTVPTSFLFGAIDFGTFGAAASAITMGTIAVALGGFLFWAARRSQVQKRAQRYGQRAFVVEYAAARGLEHEDPKAFHARFLRVGLPGPARNVMYGRHPQTGRETRILLCQDPTGTTAGFEVAVVPPPDAGARADPPRDGDITVRADDGYIVAFRATEAGAGPSIAGLDAVASAADSAARGVPAPTPTTTTTSSSSSSS